MFISVTAVLVQVWVLSPIHTKLFPLKKMKLIDIINGNHLNTFLFELLQPFMNLSNFRC